MHTENASRRGFLTSIVGSAIAASLPFEAGGQAESRSLRAIAAEKGILFGSAVGAGKPGTLTGSFADARYLEVLQRECAVLVPENELKSYVISAERDQLDFEPGDRIARFAKDHGMKLRGHTLLWNRTEFMPKWLAESFGALSASAGERYLHSYIERVCTHYRTQIHSWTS